LALVLALALVFAGCASATPSGAEYPAPVASAAQPAVTGKGDLAYTRRAIDAIRNALKNYDPDEALATFPRQGLHLDEAGVAAECVAAPGAVPVLACHFGPDASQPVAQALFWFDLGTWQGQLYPQASPSLAAERRTLLAERDCQLGCYSGMSQARQAPGPEGNELLVVTNLGFAGGQRAEEVHLLRLTGDEWRVAWAPAPGTWNYGHAQVEIGPRGLNQFTVHSSSWLRRDVYSGYLAEDESAEHRHFHERWLRKDDGYIMVDRREEPSAYGTLVRLVHYLSSGADEKAAELLGQGVSLEQARKALAQKPKRQGWKVTPADGQAFLLDTRKEGKPTLGVRFARYGDGWVLAEMWQPGS
jgi:hypothetical protein